ncbi:MAG: ornithine cyclodeaminase family protein [Chloroflexota bacterium]
MYGRPLIYLSRANVEKVALSMQDILLLIENAFREKAAGQVEMPPKPGIHPQANAFIHAMPAYIPALHAAGIKWVGSYPNNPQHGLPIISGLIILNDPETGIPCAVMDCTWITAYRTGAATALAAKHLADPKSEVVGIIACGVQGRTNLEALAALFPIRRVCAYDISREVLEQYVEDIRKQFDFEILPVDDPRKAVVDSDIIVTSVPIQKTPTPTIQKNWLKPGAFASSVDFGSCWSLEALTQLAKVSTDDIPQFQYYRSLGYFPGFPEPYASLDEIVSTQKPGREDPQERIIAINLGLAMEDIAVAPEIYYRAIDMGIGTPLPL